MAAHGPGAEADYNGVSEAWGDVRDVVFVNTTHQNRAQTNCEAELKLTRQVWLCSIGVDEIACRSIQSYQNQYEMRSWALAICIESGLPSNSRVSSPRHARRFSNILQFRAQ